MILVRFGQAPQFTQAAYPSREFFVYLDTLRNNDGGVPEQTDQPSCRSSPTMGRSALPFFTTYWRTHASAIPITRVDGSIPQRVINWRIRNGYHHKCVCSPKDAQTSEAISEIDRVVCSRATIKADIKALASCEQFLPECSVERLFGKQFNRKEKIMTTTDTSELTRPSHVKVRARDNFMATLSHCKPDRQIERRLHKQKWFDYRFISPMAATERFYALYQAVYRRKYAANFDTFEAERKTGVSKKRTRAELTSFWRARQFADELGVTYEIFLEAAFQVCIRKGWARLPHMNQLYGNKSREVIAESVKSLWADHIGDRFTISVLPQYREESYEGLDSQIEHRKWVMDQLKARHGSALRIGRACFVHRVVPEATAFLEFGQDRLDQAKAEIEFNGIAPDELSPGEPSLPSCFGLPGVPDPGGDQCDRCPAFRPCLKLETLVRNAVAKKFGTDDPVLSRQKAQGRIRTAKHRAKKILKPN